MCLDSQRHRWCTLDVAIKYGLSHDFLRSLLRISLYRFTALIQGNYFFV